MASGSSTSLRALLLLGGALALSGCNATDLPGFLSGGGGETTPAAEATRSVERDVEAPEVFQVADSGLWDGRPSLGGVWVAHPSVTDPERVIIRNTSNGQFVIGVVYRPERVTPGPKFQVSSDAAAALEMLAGQPAELNVTALRREETPEPVEAPAAEAVVAGSVATSTLDPIAAASEALDAAQSAPAMSAAAVTPPAAAAAPAPAAAPVQSSTLDKPYVQIGIFSVESNARSTADTLRNAGMVPSVKEGKLSGKAFWRVVVGPAATAAERTALLEKINGLGFTDAYAVTN
ncbi:MAG: SPOR domain-containing protein [Paracoccaceae bacterium]